MSESNESNGGASEAPEVVVESGRRISPIWLIPIVAVIVAGSLAYQAIQNRGPRIVILFESAEGLEAGKSKVKYLEVEIGTVDLVQIHDPKTVAVHCTIDKHASKYITKSAQFWVVRPRVGGGGITGLGTLVSGSYVTFRLGKLGDPPERRFTGLETPPLSIEDDPGLQIVLHTDHLGGLDNGSPVFFRDIHVGDVLRYELSKDGKTVNVQVVIGSSHASFVRTNSRFWNAGGGRALARIRRPRHQDRVAPVHPGGRRGLRLARGRRPGQERRRLLAQRLTRRRGKDRQEPRGPASGARDGLPRWGR